MREINIACPSGVGEAWWVNSKLRAIKEHLHADRVVVNVVNSSFNRAAAAHRMFPWVNDVRFVHFPIQPAGKVRSDKGSYEYLPSHVGFHTPAGVMDWLLIPNQHIEEGHRLDTWLPDFTSDNEDLGQHFKPSPKENIVATKIAEEVFGVQDYALLYLGPLAGNTTAGHNRNHLWTPENWIELISAIHKVTGLHFIVVGEAAHDLSYLSEVIQPLLYRHNMPYVHNAIGMTETTNEVYTLAKKAKFFISYQCGLGIGAVYLGVRTVMWWRPNGDSISSHTSISPNEEMRHVWAPKKYLNGTYLHQVYTKCSPTSILCDMIANSWVT